GISPAFLDPVPLERQRGPACVDSKQDSGRSAPAVGGGAAETSGQVAQARAADDGAELGARTLGDGRGGQGEGDDEQNAADAEHGALEGGGRSKMPAPARRDTRPRARVQRVLGPTGLPGTRSTVRQVR